MEENSPAIKEKIISYLQTKQRGASCIEIAKAIGHNRVTIAKYLEIFKAENVLTTEDIAQATFWRIKEEQKPKILIVDDEKYVVKLIKLSLPTAYSIKEAYSGKEAWACIERDLPELIILDLMMPEISGYDILEKMKGHPQWSKIPVIILTAKGQVADKIKGYQTGALMYLTKPFDPAELAARVRSILEKKQQQEYHPLTHLPTGKQVERAVREAVFSKTHQNFYCLSISFKKDAEEKFGFKKGQELLVVFAKILQETLPQESFLGQDSHTQQYIIITKKENIKDEIQKLFGNILQYILPGEKNPEEEISLNIKMVTLDEIRNKKIYINDVLSYLQE